MCLIALALNAHAQYPLVLIGNRDEFHHRPTLRSHWWAEGLYAGKDLQAGGTWMGVHPEGRIAALTNIRNLNYRKSPDQNAPSRGQLVTAALQTGQLPIHPMAYEGFNLLLAQREPADHSPRWTVHYAHNHRAESSLMPVQSHQPLEAGIHVVSNGHLNEPWPKSKQLGTGLKELLSGHHDNLLYDSGLLPAALAMLSDTRTYPDYDLPATGVPLDWERMLSATKIISEGYGTRSSTVLAVDTNGQVMWTEVQYDAGGSETSRASERFMLLMPRNPSPRGLQPRF